MEDAFGIASIVFQVLREPLLLRPENEKIVVFGLCIYMQVKLGLNSIKCNNVSRNKIKPLHISANEGHHRKATNTSKKMLHIYYMHVVLYGLH
jgi:hypothetical protein